MFFFATTFIIALVPGMFVRLVAPERVLDVARMWARIIVGAARIICGIRLQVHGLERLEGPGARLIASNHQSAFDTIVWLTLLPRCCYVVKQELLRIPLFGPLLSLSGMIAVDRGGGAAALRLLLREADRALREKRQIVIFPEGTRATPGVSVATTVRCGRARGQNASAGRPGRDGFGSLLGAPGIPEALRHNTHTRAGTDPRGNHSRTSDAMPGNHATRRSDEVGGGCGKLCGLTRDAAC